MLRFPRLDRRDKQKLPNKSGTLTEVFTRDIEGKPFEKWFPSNFFPKTFEFKFLRIIENFGYLAVSKYGKFYDAE